MATALPCRLICLRAWRAQCMSQSTTIRVSPETHAWVIRLAAERHETIDETVELRSRCDTAYQTQVVLSFA